MRVLLLGLLAAALSACSTAHCRKPGDYAAAQSLPALPIVDGLKLQESPSALRIPPAPENPVAFGEKYRDEDGDERWSCLDVPPRLEIKEEAEAPR